MNDLFTPSIFPEPSGATFSPCRTFRYTLWRSWPSGSGYACFIGLNPSTADETEDDPTIRRCIAYAKAWGYAGLVMLNAFGYRATYPRDMLAAHDPVGPDNDEHIRLLTRDAAVVIAAWGNHGEHLERFRAIGTLVPKLSCLKVTKPGHPSHPLYLKADLRPMPYELPG